MTALIRSELLQLRTLRTTYLLPLALLGLTALITFASMEDLGNPGMTTPDQLREPFVVSAGIMGAVFLAVFAVIRVGGEYRYETISQRMLAASRPRVLTTKLVAYGGVALVLSALAVGIGLAITAPAVSAEGLSLDYDGAGLVQLFASALFGTVLFATLGVATAFICRSQTAALLVVIGLFPAEKILGLVIGGDAAFMPYGLLQAMIDQGGAASPALAAVLLTGTVAAVTVAAWILVGRRDVTR
jgi:ABC-type transport system involved in multi-copper enzyme maturation permease subunit